jgi:sodium transport system permease protein
MRTLLTVFRKEFLDNLRDRRTLMSAILFGPLFGPLLFGLMISRMLEQSVVEADEPLKITIAGSAYAPGLARFLESQGVQLIKKEFTEADARSAVRTGHETPVIVMVPEEYPKLFSCCCLPTAPTRRPAKLPIARGSSWAPMAAPSRSNGCRFAA